MGSGDLGGVDDVEFWRAEAERLTTDNLVLQTRVAELEGQVSALTEKVSVLARLAFGASSEKTAKRAPVGDDPTGESTGGQAKRGRGQRRGSRGHGRRDYSHLPTREEIHDVPESQRVCPRCGAGYAPFGQECCEQIDWQVALTRIVHRRPTYRRTCRCAVRGVLVAPPVPKAIAKGRFTSGFLARLLCEKFVLGRPAHRIVAALAHDGFHVAEGTLAAVFAACAELLAPLAEAITQRNAAAAHLHIDETSWNVYAAVEGKDSHRWWCWVFVGPDTTVFTIAPSRSLTVLTAQLGIDTDPDTDTLTLPAGRQAAAVLGLLHRLPVTVYQSLGRLEGVDNLWCWSPIRRYFIRAGDAHPELAAWTAGWVERIAALYVAHTAMAAAQPASPAHTWAGAQFSAALNTIDAHRTAQGSAVRLVSLSGKCRSSIRLPYTPAHFSSITVASQAAAVAASASSAARTLSPASSSRLSPRRRPSTWVESVRCRPPDPTSPRPASATSRTSSASVSIDPVTSRVRNSDSTEKSNPGSSNGSPSAYFQSIARRTMSAA
jgi:transposase